MSEPITFNANPLDRAGNLRRSAGWIAERLNDPTTRVLPLNELKALISFEAGAAPGWRSVADVAPFIARGAPAIFLGLREDRAHFAIDVTGADAKAPPFCNWGKFIDVRSIAPDLQTGEAGTLAQARAMIDWHARHRFCAVCGAPSAMREAGYSRQCRNGACGASHFPRTDPVVIMLVIDGEECLLGRSRHFPKGNYSALAGFVEPGESIEEAVRREIAEEVSVHIGAVRYVASQFWPFPSSLMIGCFATAESREITLDAQEIEDARWFHRDDIARMLNRGPGDEGPRMPPPLSLAHQLARRWLAGV